MSVGTVLHYTNVYRVNAAKYTFLNFSESQICRTEFESLRTIC